MCQPHPQGLEAGTRPGRLAGAQGPSLAWVSHLAAFTVTLYEDPTESLAPLFPDSPTPRAH